MKVRQILGLILLCLFIVSCSSDDKENSDIDKKVSYVGKWMLIEVLSELDDGNFKAVSSNKEIEFFSDGTLKCNGSLCDVESIDKPSQGTYKNGGIISDCSAKYQYCLEQIDGYVIITYPKNKAKYKKINLE